MESSVWQQSPVLKDILANGHRYHFHQLLMLLEQLLPKGRASEFNARVKIRPDTSLAFPASDIRSVAAISGQRFEVVCRFLGLYGVDSPLPQYFLDDVTAEDAAGKQLQTFLDIFNHRLYGLLHQAWKKQSPFTQLDESGLYQRLIRATTGQYWHSSSDAMAYGGNFIGSARSSESLEDILREAMSLEELNIDSDVISWVPIEDGLCLNGQQALGLDTCLGDAIPVIGRKVEVQIGPVSHDVSQALQPKQQMGQKMAGILKEFLPDGVDFDVSIQLTPKFSHNWQLGSEQSLLSVHSILGEASGKGLTFKMTSKQFETNSAQQVA
ncbi:type VI secretion system baseplate subunit TssG [Reinekea marinisedimentorum]|uniref:Type VI secretion system protein ImpH n=1 Tax=Reinekea marinisedimentorum TaxID=230495 RepID=A0A4R3I5Y0_9GAMM|nr:type VI secretion system baseplate subunit TssG [Reinekea marinisedimentorum]TCS41299.1 type VI secretion system protein ImpH [Reinekea marinisedimentorum]